MSFPNVAPSPTLFYIHGYECLNEAQMLDMKVDMSGLIIDLVMLKQKLRSLPDERPASCPCRLGLLLGLL